MEHNVWWVAAQVGEETEDGFTNIKLRRKLETDDQAGDYCMVKVRLLNPLENLSL